jgi:hypothetical protein
MLSLGLGLGLGLDTPGLVNITVNKSIIESSNVIASFEYNKPDDESS